jgi:hypothetical protein
MPDHLRCPGYLSHATRLLGALLVASAVIGTSVSAAPEAREPALAREILRDLIDTRSTHDIGTTELARKC